jgi:hypothetical protein
MRVYNQESIGEWNTDVATSSMVIAATAANTTAISTDVGYSDVDEMSLSYITSRWGQLNYFSYDTSAAAATMLYATVICPLAWWFRAPSTLPATNKVVGRFSTATTNSVQPTHLMFAASSFKQWRGGVKFRFTFAKTKMHAGRVMVAFNPFLATPNNTTALTSATTAQLANYGSSGPDPFAYSAVFDLKDGNVFEFKVPYISPVYYANTASTVGSLVMYVVNPLVAPSVVSNTVQVLVEIAGDVDFELANPAGVMFPVHVNGTPNIQSGKKVSVSSGTLISQTPEVANQRTMGEIITSVKQLISIPHVKVYLPATDYFLIVPPWFYTPAYGTFVPANNTPLSYSFSYGGSWAACYGFLKGGTDLHAFAPPGNEQVVIQQVSNPASTLLTTVTPDNRSTSNAPSLISLSPGTHTRLPSFFPTARVYSWIATIMTAAGTTWSTNPSTSSTNVNPYYGIQALYWMGAGGAAGVWSVTRNASDDAQLAMYVGPPPLWLPAGPAATGSFDPDEANNSFGP